MTSGSKRKHGAAIGFQSGLVFIIVILMLAMQFLPISMAQTTSSDIIVPSGGTINITGPEFSVKGSIIVLSGGTLNIEETTLNIYQDHDRQFEVTVERGGTIRMADSIIRASNAIDIYLEEDSRIELKGSEIRITGKLTGYPDMFYAKESTINVDHLDVHATKFVMEASTVYSDDCTISTDNGIIEDSLLFTPLTVIDNSYILFKGSSAEKITVLQNSIVEIYYEINLDVKDSAGIPVAGASVSATRFDMLKPSVELYTDKKGELSTYLLSEVIHPVGSVYNGNYIVECSLGGYTVSGTISLPPVEEYSSDEVETKSKRISLVFDDVLPPTEYYNQGPDDLYVRGDTDFNIQTYPKSGVTTYIHEGNIFVDDSSSMEISEGSEFKILQRDKNYRIELRGTSVLSIGKGAQISSDKPLNIYMYGSSRLIVEEGTLHAGMIVGMGSSSINIDSGEIYFNRFYFKGEHLEISASSFRGEKFNIESEELIINDSIFELDEASIYSHSLNMSGTDFNTPLILGSDSDEIHITDVNTPEIIPSGDLIVKRYWQLSLRMINTQNLLVPGTDVELYRRNGEGMELLETVYVPDGRTSFIVLGEIIDSEGRRFVGNYMVKATKDVGNTIFESLETTVAVNENVETIVKFEQHFPYRLVIDVDIPDKIYQRNESFVITGVAYYEGADLDVANVTVNVRIGNFEDLVWQTKTDANGEFDIEIRSPPFPGRYTLVATLIDGHMNMSAEKRTNIVVDGEEEVFSFREFMFNSPLGIVISIVMIMVLSIFAYVILVWPFGKERPSLTTSSSEELVQWAENIVGRR